MQSDPGSRDGVTAVGCRDRAPDRKALVNLEQKRLVTAVCVITGVSFLVSASLQFLITPMLTDLGLSNEEAGTALAVPSVGALLIVFAAGRVGDRVGHRRVLEWAAVPFVVGSLLVAAAPGIAFVSLGLLFAGAAATALQIVALGLLQTAVPDGPSRIAAFTSFGMVFPTVYLAVPVLTGWLVGVAPWRIVPLAWAVCGVAVPLLAAHLIPRPEPARAVGELWTPTFAGVALAAAVQLVNHGHDHGWTTPGTALWLAVLVLAVATVLVLRRATRAASLSLRLLRSRHLVLLLVAVALIAMSSSLTYITLGLEYLYGQTVLGAAVWLIPANAAAILGAKVVADRLMLWWGVARSGQAMLGGLTLSLLSLVLLGGSSPMAQLILSSALISLFAVGGITIVNAAVMSGAPPDETGMVSSYRGAASALGAALGIVIVGAAVTTAVAATSSVPAGAIPDPAALATGLQANGLVGAGLAAVAAAAFTWAFGRQSGRGLTSVR